MVGTIVDACVVFLILGMTYALMSEGLWGAALQFFNALFASLITLNFYEPLATLIATNVSFLSGYADALCILLIFCVSLFVLRMATEAMAPTMIRFPMPVFHLGRIFFGLAGSVVTMGMLLIALDATPGQKKIFSVYDYKYVPMYKSRLDKEMLAFFQYSTGYVFSRSGGKQDPMGEFGTARIFDPKGDWLIRSQEARPHGEGEILETEESAKAAESGGAAAGGEAGGAQGAPTSPGPGGGRRGGRGGEGAGIPGGTAGAAVGLAPM
jgi:hypothetical protein